MMRSENAAQGGCRWGRTTTLAVAFVLAAAGGVRAGVVTVTDCVNDPHLAFSGGTTKLDVGADDLALECDLVAPENKVVIAGAAITITGSITARQAINITATGALVVEGATLAATDGQGAAQITAGGDMTFKRAVVQLGNERGTGGKLKVTCTGTQPTPCNITARQSSFTGKRIEMTARGELYFGLVEVVSRSPLDWIRLTAEGGDATMRGCGNLIATGPEGSLDLHAFGAIDLAFSQVLVARDINILSGYGATPQVPAAIRLTGATVSNESGKPGHIVVSASANTQGINISGATIIDDESDVASLNGRGQVPHEGFNNIVGPPDRDE